MFPSHFRHFSRSATRSPPPRAGPVGGLRDARGAAGRQPRRREVGPAGPRAVRPDGPGRRMGPVVRGDGPGHGPPGQLPLPVLLLQRPAARLGASCGPSTTKTAKQLGGVGVVRQRLDGFVSADADHKGGLADDARRSSSAATACGSTSTRGRWARRSSSCRTQAGGRIPASRSADCEEIGGNFIDQQVYWKGNADVSALAARPFGFTSSAKRAKLYAFQFTQE